MSRLTRFLVVLCIASCAAAIRADDALLERDVLPVFTKQCLGCHGGLRQKGNLDLRTVPAMLKGGKSGPAIKPGDAAASELVKRIAADEMPPGEKKLTADEKAAIQKWIADGLPTVADRQKNIDPLLAPGSKHEPRQVADAIDQHVDRALGKIAAAALSDDAEFLRRVFLDLNGRVPTPDEARKFLDSTDPDRRAKLIDQLLASPRFGEQFGRTWRDWICPPELPSDGNGGAQPINEANNFGKWFAARFNAGDSWDKITREIITVDGETKKHPQAIFYALVGTGGNANAGGSARAVGSLFLGVQLQCAECHDDPYRSWAQKQHWGLAAFFGKTSADFNKVSEAMAKKDGQIVIPKSAFKNAGDKVQTAFLGGEDFTPPADGPLRPALADWVVSKDNPYFAKAFANRAWFYLFARGIVNPVDDLRDLNPPSHPGLLALLANEFRDSGFDVKHLFRCVCNSKAYQRTTRVAAGTSEQAIAGSTDLFGRMPMRVMTADVLYDSLLLAYGDTKLDLRGIDPKDGNTNGQSAPVADAHLEFLRRFGTNKDDATDFTHGIPQMLAMINHPNLQRGSKSLDAFLKANKNATPEQAVEWLYLATLSRRPTDAEASDARRYLERVNDPSRGYAGVLWMLVNRSEYLLVR